MEAGSVADRVLPLAERVAARAGYDVVHVEFFQSSGRWVLRVYIDSSEGITLEDCTAMSRQMSAVLDVEDCIAQRYTLEVSSPGLDRPLRRARDFVRFSGERVRIRTSTPIDGRRRFKGTLEGFAEEVVVLTDSAGEVFQIPFGTVDKARLDPQF